jgi:hypothetical protein
MKLFSRLAAADCRLTGSLSRIAPARASTRVDSTRSAVDGRKVVERAPFALNPGEPQAK